MQWHPDHPGAEGELERDGAPDFGAPVSTSTALAEPSGTPAALRR